MIFVFLVDVSYVEQKLKKGVSPYDYMNVLEKRDEKYNFYLRKRFVQS